MCAAGRRLPTMQCDLAEVNYGMSSQNQVSQVQAFFPGQDVKLTIPLQLEPRLTQSGATPRFSLYKFIKWKETVLVVE